VAARYALSTFVVQLPSGASHLVEGALRDSAHPAVTANAAAFTTTPVTPKSVHLQQYLAAYPGGP
jgi:hypothetical protein